MKRIFTLLATSFVFIASLDARASEEFGTKEEAVAMVKRAVAEIKAEGLNKVVAEVNNPKGKYKDRDLYIMIYDMKGKNIAHGANPKMIGKDLYDLKDIDGNYFIRERLEIAKTKGSGWQEYKFTNPVTQKIEPKILYIEKVDDVVVTSGAYKEHQK